MNNDAQTTLDILIMACNAVWEAANYEEWAKLCAAKDVARRALPRRHSTGRPRLSEAEQERRVRVEHTWKDLQDAKRIRLLQRD